MKLASMCAAAFAASMSFAAAEPAINDLAFLEGSWRGQDGETVHEELWTGPEAGVMIGLFKLRTGDKFNISEFLVIAEEESRVILRFKHFRRDFTSWEADGEPIILVLVQSGNNEAVFEADNEDADVRSLKFRINDEDELVSSVIVKKDPPETGVEEFSFTYQRR